MSTAPDGDDRKVGSKECAGEMMHAVADKLRDYGIDVRLPDCEESRQLRIVNAKDARSDITVHDSGYIMWEYWPSSAANTKPHDIAAVVLRVLGHARGNVTPEGRALTLRGAVGRELRARGLDVTMLVYQEDDTFEVTTEIAAVNPARPEFGRVCVTDEGSVTWDCYVDGPKGECTLTVIDNILAVLVHGIEASSSWLDAQASLWLPSESYSMQAQADTK